MSFEAMLAAMQGKDKTKLDRVVDIHLEMDDWFIKFDEIGIDLVDLCGWEYEHYPWHSCSDRVEVETRSRIVDGRKKRVKIESSDLKEAEAWFKEFRKHLNDAYMSFRDLGKTTESGKTKFSFSKAFDAFQYLTATDNFKQFDRKIKLVKKTWKSRPKAADPVEGFLSHDICCRRRRNGIQKT